MLLLVSAGRSGILRLCGPQVSYLCFALLSYARAKAVEPLSARQQNHLSPISEFTTSMTDRPERHCACSAPPVVKASIKFVGAKFVWQVL